jgi:hypothetical protein
VVADARAAQGKPGLDDVRLAHLIGDAAVITRAQAAVADPFVRLALELAAAGTPSNTAIKDDLSYLQAQSH